ncbi:MAG: putative ABC transporter permease [Clostridia bacterium]
MTKDFSNPKKLGFMRVVQVVYAGSILFSVFMLAIMAKDSGSAELGAAIADALSHATDASNVRPLAFADILGLGTPVFSAVGFWLIWKRKKFARPFVIGLSCFFILSGLAYNLYAGTFNLQATLVRSIFDLFIIVYFATSRRVKAVLVEPFSLESEQIAAEEERSFFKPRTWVFWRNLIIYFCVFSVVGHWMEALYCTFIKMGILPGIYDPNSQIWRDWLYPFVVYGFGAVACVLLLYPLKTLLQKKFKGLLTPLVLSFVANAIVCSLIELAMGLMLNQPRADGSLPLWDYRDMFGNFMGQICLQNGIAFGLVATLMTWIIYPALETLMRKIPRDVATIVFIAVVVGFVVLYMLYCVNVLIPSFTLGNDVVGLSVSSE